MSKKVEEKLKNQSTLLAFEGSMWLVDQEDGKVKKFTLGIEFKGDVPLDRGFGRVMRGFIKTLVRLKEHKMDLASGKKAVLHPKLIKMIPEKV